MSVERLGGDSRRIIMRECALGDAIRIGSSMSVSLKGREPCETNEVACSCTPVGENICSISIFTEEINRATNDAGARASDSFLSIAAEMYSAFREGFEITSRAQ